MQRLTQGVSRSSDTVISEVFSAYLYASPAYTCDTIATPCVGQIASCQAVYLLRGRRGFRQFRLRRLVMEQLVGLTAISKARRKALEAHVTATDRPLVFQQRGAVNGCQETRINGCGLSAVRSRRDEQLIERRACEENCAAP